MNILERNKLKSRLIEIYNGYVEDVNDKEVRKRAQDLFFEFVYASDSMDKDLLNAISGLEHIGWEFSRSTKTVERDWKMSKENAEMILAKLGHFNL